MNDGIRESYESARLRVDFRQVHGRDGPRRARRVVRIPGRAWLIAAALGAIALLLGRLL